MRAILESCGVRDVLTKSLGSNNPFNLAKATMAGLARMKRTEEVRALRGAASPRTA